MNQSRKLIGVALALVLAACAPEPATETLAMPQFDPQTVHVTVAEFVSAWNAGEVTGMSRNIAEDAVLMQPDGPLLIGREAIVSSIAENYDLNLFQQSATVDEAAAIGNMAYARGTWTLQPTSEAGADVASTNGMWSVIYKRGPERNWQIWRWMWNQPSGQTAGIPPTE